MCGGVGGERFALHLIQPKVLFVIAAKLACPLVQLVVLEASVIAPWWKPAAREGRFDHRRRGHRLYVLERSHAAVA